MQGALKISCFLLLQLLLLSTIFIVTIYVAADIDPLDCGEDDYLLDVTPANASTHCYPHDRAALLAFKSRISSDPNRALATWINNNSNATASNCCQSWKGVTCDGTTGRVVSLNLQDTDIHGSISPGISGLSHLQVLKLDGNAGLSGSLPASLGRLASLLQLCLSGSSMSGKIPESLGTGLTNVRVIDIRSSRFSGPLPSTIGGMSQLKELHIYGNQFSGPIPPSFGKLSNLFDADMGSNKFSGVIPDAFNDNLTSLLYLFLDNNLITGVPKTLSNLKRLQWVTLSNNPIKNADNVAGVATLPQLAELWLDNCQLSGRFPAWISRFPRFNTDLMGDEVTPYLSLSHNNLSGPIPTHIGSYLPDYMQRLLLNNNRFSGPIPASLSKLQSLTFFNVSYNKLTGKIPQVAPLTSFDASAYEGNAGLCGKPLAACKK